MKTLVHKNCLPIEWVALPMLAKWTTYTSIAELERSRLPFQNSMKNFDDLDAEILSKLYTKERSYKRTKFRI